MTIPCKGCGEDLANLYPALSRYGHGDICPECGTREAYYGDFIRKYNDRFSLEYPCKYIVEADRIV
jgi:hypothetical protein